MNFNSLKIGFGELQTVKNILAKVVTIAILLLILIEHKKIKGFIINITRIIGIKTIHHMEVEQPKLQNRR